MLVQGFPEGPWLGCWRGQREALVLAAVAVETLPAQLLPDGFRTTISERMKPGERTDE